MPEQSAGRPNKPLAGRRLLLPIARFRAVILLINYSQIPCARPTAPLSWILRFLALRRNRPLQTFPTQPSRTVWVGPVLRVHRHSSPIILLATTRLRCLLPNRPTESGHLGTVRGVPKQGLLENCSGADWRPGLRPRKALIRRLRLHRTRVQSSTIDPAPATSPRHSYSDRLRYGLARQRPPFAGARW